MLNCFRGEKMNQAFFSFLTGLFYTSGLFFICLFTVVGAKTLIIQTFIKRSATKKRPTKKPQKPPEVEKATPSEPKPIKSIEINPDEIDRIYVKKSG